MKLITYRALMITLFVFVLGNDIPFALSQQGSSTSSEDITAIEWKKSGDWIAYGKHDGNIHLLNLTTQQRIDLIGHRDIVIGLAWNSNGTMLASTSRDLTVRIWDTATGVNLYTFSDYYSPCFALIWSPDDTKVIGGSLMDTNNIHIWDVTQGNLVGEYESGSVLGLLWNPDKTEIAFLAPNGNVLFIDPNTWQVADNVLLSPEHDPDHAADWNSYTAEWNSNGEMLATGSINGSIRLWDIKNATLIWDLRGSEALEIGFDSTMIKDLSFTTDGKYLRSVSANGSVRTWDVATGHLIEVRQLENNALDSAAFNPEGSQLAYSIDDSLRIMDIINIP